MTPAVGAGSAESLIGGFHAVAAALEQQRSIVGIWLATSRQDRRAQALRAAAKKRGIEVREAAMTELDERLPEVRHQGCIAEIKDPRPLRESQLPGLLAAGQRPWVLVLDCIQDPHNLGACLRSAAAAGVAAVLAPRRRSAGLNATVCKVAAGAAERVAFVAVTNVVRSLERLKTEGFWIVGLDSDAPGSIYDVELPDRLVLVAGGEAHGMRARTTGHCDWRVSIPMAAAIESLNVSVAVGVALFEARRQRARRAPVG